MLDDFEELVETIRVQLSKGIYQMDLHERPYSGTSRLLASILYGKGYRVANRPREALQQALASEHNVWIALEGARMGLQDEHDKVSAEMEHPDDYQRGVLHGIDKGLVELREKIEICEANIKAYHLQLTNVIGRDKLNP